MSSIFIPLVFLIVSGWVLDVADSFPTLTRIAREVQGDRMEAGLRERPKDEFHQGSADAPLALSSGGRHHPQGTAAELVSGKMFGDMDGHSTGEQQLSGHGHYSGDHHLSGHEHPTGEHHLSDNGHPTGEHHLSDNGHPTGEHHLNGLGHHTGEHHLSGHLGQGHHRPKDGETGGIHSPLGDLSFGGDSTSSSHSGGIGGSAAGMEQQSGGHQHSIPTVSGGHGESLGGTAAGGLVAASGGEQEIMGQLMEIWMKIGGPQMLGKIAAMSGNMYGAGAGASYPPPRRAMSAGGTGSMGGNTQSFRAGGVTRGGAGHITTGRIGAGSNTTQPEEVVYVMVVPGYGGMSKGRYPSYNTAGTYKLAQGGPAPGSITYTAIPVGSVTTRGYSLQGRPMFYGGTGRRGGSTYTAWPVTYGSGASRQYSVVAYTAVPAGQAVTTGAEQGVVRPAATAQAAYYTLQGGRVVATTQQHSTSGMTYAALPAVLAPAQTYKVASG